MSDLTDLEAELQPIEARARSVDSPPWRSEGSVVRDRRGNSVSMCSGCGSTAQFGPADAAFIASAPSDVLALIDTVRTVSRQYAIATGTPTVPRPSTPPDGASAPAAVREDPAAASRIRELSEKVEHLESELSRTREQLAAAEAASESLSARANQADERFLSVVAAMWENLNPAERLALSGS